MQEEEIKTIVKKYRTRSIFILCGVLIFSIFVNWYLIDRSIKMHYEAGLEYSSTGGDYTWGAIILGLNVVLISVFYSIEKILIEIFKRKNNP